MAPRCVVVICLRSCGAWPRFGGRIMTALPARMCCAQQSGFGFWSMAIIIRSWAAIWAITHTRSWVIPAGFHSLACIWSVCRPARALASGIGMRPRTKLVLVLSGHPVLIEDTETLLNPGDMVCWPAGQPTGHQLQNRSSAEAVYLTLGTRLTRDTIHYPDHDLITHKDGTTRRYTHADGRPRNAGDRI